MKNFPVLHPSSLFLLASQTPSGVHSVVCLSFCPYRESPTSPLAMCTGGNISTWVRHLNTSSLKQMCWNRERETEEERITVRNSYHQMRDHSGRKLANNSLLSIGDAGIYLSLGLFKAVWGLLLPGYASRIYNCSEESSFFVWKIRGIKEVEFSEQIKYEKSLYWEASS